MCEDFFSKENLREKKFSDLELIIEVPTMYAIVFTQLPELNCEGLVLQLNKREFYPGL